MIWVNYWERSTEPPHRIWHNSQKLHWYLLTQLIPQRLRRLSAWARYNGRFRGFDQSETLAGIPNLERLNQHSEVFAGLGKFEAKPMSKREYRDYLRRLGIDPHKVEGAW